MTVMGEILHRPVENKAISAHKLEDSDLELFRNLPVNRGSHPGFGRYDEPLH